MKKRTKKLLSLLLAAAMVFTTNTIAFAEEVTVDAVDDTAEAEEVVVDEADVVLDADDSKKVTISSNVMEWYAATANDEKGYNFMAKYFLGYSDGGKGDGVKHFDSDHLVNGKPVTISKNYGSDEELGPYYNYDSNLASPDLDWIQDKDNKKKYESKFNGADWNSSTVSSNVFDLGDSTYLLVAYRIIDAVDSNIGTNAPVVPFNGLKYTAYKENNGRTLRKENSDIIVEAALVKQTEGNAPELIANSVSMTNAKKPKSKIEVSIKPKNNQYANVSMNAYYNGDFFGYLPVENPYIKNKDDVPCFTISVKINADKTDADLKKASKLLKKAKDQYGVELKKSEFKFDICRNIFAKANFDKISENDVDGNEHDSFSLEKGFRHAYPNLTTGQIDNGMGNGEAYVGNWIASRTLTLDTNEDKTKVPSWIAGTISLFTDAKKAGKNNIPVYLINATGDYDAVVNAAGWNRKKKWSSYKLKKDKDYKVTAENGVLTLEPIGNFEGDAVVFRNVEYTLPAGYGSLTKEKKVTELRVGIKNMKTENWYCDSVED